MCVRTVGHVGLVGRDRPRNYRALDGFVPDRCRLSPWWSASRSSQLATYTTTIYLHRSLAHRAMVIRNPLRFVMRFGLWMSTGIVPRQWVAVHRKHHAFTDEERRPPLPSPARLEAGPALELLRSTGARPAIRRSSSATPRTCSPTCGTRCSSTTPCSGLGLGIVLLVWLLGPWVGHRRGGDPHA